ncbi:hypothetical protein STCU_02879 [Strigomonas culicis]|uniref:Uncharacterized protein n=1 Tax=Strigomonas culicis TaxID=28005 RepID=S9U945_9TRYP|nr:hypothetical protein STCU_05824 [Strigomonas culicis]EPY32302.1 hypothetical protein STCU_02879 [Strigomonas culicis]|eukprot:EPY27292.1 hypothetical protein STCU_05824 [Strigomonas culicis]
MASIVDISDNHGVVISYKPTLSPENIEASLRLFGSISIITTYILDDSNYLTAVLFSEPRDNFKCFNDYHSILDDGQIPLLNVGWAHEDGFESLIKKPHVKAKYVQATEAKKGYLVFYWKPLNVIERADVKHYAQSVSVDSFTDEKEGGRLFMCLKDEDTADACFSELSKKYPSLSHSISYADERDFNLARGK